MRQSSALILHCTRLHCSNLDLNKQLSLCPHPILPWPSAFLLMPWFLIATTSPLSSGLGSVLFSLSSCNPHALLAILRSLLVRWCIRLKRLASCLAQSVHPAPPEGILLSCLGSCEHFVGLFEHPKHLTQREHGLSNCNVMDVNQQIVQSSAGRM